MAADIIGIVAIAIGSLVAIAIVATIVMVARNRPAAAGAQAPRSVPGPRPQHARLAGIGDPRDSAGRPPARHPRPPLGQIASQIAQVRSRSQVAQVRSRSRWPTPPSDSSAGARPVRPASSRQLRGLRRVQPRSAARHRARVETTLSNGRLARGSAPRRPPRCAKPAAGRGTSPRWSRKTSPRVGKATTSACSMG